jgi:hypothetical protein
VLKKPVTYKQLGAEQREIVRAKHFNGKSTVPALIDLLVPLAHFDESGDRSRRRVRRLFLGSCVATVGSVVLMLMSGGAAVVLPMPIAAAGLAIGAGLRYRRLRDLDLSNNLRQVVVPLLAVLREEVDPQMPIALEVDLRLPTARQKLVDESPPRSERGYFRVIDRFYKDAWMTAEADLISGARLGWTIVDQVLEQEKSKRNARGKTKTKTKYKRRTDLSVRLTLPRPAGTPDGTKRETIKVDNSVKSRSLEPIDPRLLIDLVASAYGGPAVTPASPSTPGTRPR